MWEVRVSGRIGALTVEATVTDDASPLLLVGPNGSGKTTLLLMLLGVMTPEAGHIALGGRTLFDAGSRVSLPPEERRIGYLPQSYALFPHMNVLENVAFGLERHRIGPNRHARNETARTLLEALGIGGLAHRRVQGLSGGEQQRVALARALAPRPAALLLDEPLAALDATARRETRAFLAATLARLALPAIVTTHDPEDARALGGRVVVLEAGRVVQHDTLEAIARSPATQFGRTFATGSATEAVAETPASR
jgi:ABC-type sulfate/molybdate transport systems ATPase subunit